MSLWEDYESQYAVLTAEITAKVGQLNLTAGADKRKNVLDIEKHMGEAHELLEQMVLEIQDFKPIDRPKLRTRIDSFKAELGRLNHEFINAKKDGGEVFQQEASYVEPYYLKDEQKQRLLDNSERIERTGTQIQTGYRVLLETEDVGFGVLRDLQDQRETIERSRNRLRETDAELSRGARIVNNMIVRSMQHKFILYFIAVLFGIIVIVSIYLSAR